MTVDDGRVTLYRMTTTEALALASSASSAYETAVRYDRATYVPWRTIAIDLDAAALALTGWWVDDRVRKLRDRAEDARARADRQDAQRVARVLLVAVEVVL